MIKKRVFFLMGLILLVFLLLLIRFFYYQIIRGQDISRKVIDMHSQGIDMLEYNRGDILDRNLVPLINNHISSALYCLPQAIPTRNGSKATTCREMAHFLGSTISDLNENAIYEKIENASEHGVAIIRLYTDLSPAEIEHIKTSHYPALIVAPMNKRYGENGFLAHLIGYVNTAGEGLDGLEQLNNGNLKSNASRQELLTMLDARGRAIPGLSLKVNTEGAPRNAVVLTIDKRIQELVEKTMNQRVTKGAVVVMDAESKEVLAMASRPTYNQNQVEEYFGDIEGPLNNRVLTPYYPGSLFKIALSVAALEEKVVEPSEKFNCTGKYIYNDQVSTSCWKTEGHGELSFEQAFANSCNPTFIKVGLRLGRSRLNKYVDELHLTDAKLLGLDNVQSGTYVQIDGGEAALGNACLGQQGVMLTPLQIASLVATVADDGYWAPPAVVKYTLDDEGRPKYLPTNMKKKVIDIRTAQEVQTMMEKVVAEGTGRTASLSELKVAGKTATSQTGKLRENGEEILNTWFAGYLPAESPRWVIVVLVEEGKSGAQNCAPVFKDISQGMLEMLSAQ